MTGSPPTRRRRGGRAAGPQALVALLLAAAPTATRRPRRATWALEERPPQLPPAGPATAAWREEVRLRARELDGLSTWIAAHADSEAEAARVDRLMPFVEEHLRNARAAACDDRDAGRIARFRSSWGGASVERATGNLDAAETHLLRVAPLTYVTGEMPSLEAHVNRFLQKGDPRRTQVERIARKAEIEPLTAQDVELVIAAYHAANTQRRRDLLRVRSFRNIMWVTAGALVPLAFAVGVLTWIFPTAMPLCFYPQEKHKIVCAVDERPTQQAGADADEDPALRDIDPFVNATVHKGDVALVELIGLLAAAVATAVALRNIKGTSTPYSLPVALAAVKLPLGALTAVLGLLLMTGGFVPGLSALDSSAQVLAWAVVFGYAQQLLTRLVDQRADSLLQNVGGRGAAGDRETVTA